MDKITDKNGVKLKEGDTVKCGQLEFKIESFQNTPDGFLACGDYGCISVSYLIKDK